MWSTDRKITSILIIDALILINCVFGFIQIIQKADLPFNTIISNNKLLIPEIENVDLSHIDGLVLVNLDDIIFNNPQEIELYLDSKRIGEKVIIKYSGRDLVQEAKITLVNFYSLSELIITAFVCLVFIILGIFVKLNARENYSATVFHWASITLGVVIVTTAGNYTNAPFYLGYANRLIWLFAYSIVPVMFIHFTAAFISKDKLKFKKLLLVFYSAAFINSVIISYLFLSFSIKHQINLNRYFVTYYNSVFSLLIILSVITAVGICINAYRKSKIIEERNRLKWLLLGFLIGPFSFIALWIVPTMIYGINIIPEYLALLLLMAVPITFAIAIVKYNLLDISFIFNRSFIYTIVLAILLITFLSLSTLIALFIRDKDHTVPFTISAIMIAFMLQPVKSKIQIFVDKKFFRLEYDYKEAQKSFINAIKDATTIDYLAEKLVINTDELIPVEKIGFFIVDKLQSRIKPVSHKGFDILSGRSLRFEKEKLKTDLSEPVAVDDKVEKGVKIESADIKVFKRWGMVLVLPIKSNSGEVHAFLVLGVKKAGTRFYKDDIDLLNTVTATAALTMDRIKLQEELFLEHKISKMKSDFLSNVTHDLKTPLSSIKMYAELLQAKSKKPNYDSEEFLDIIIASTEKQKRLIDNVLDLAKIEQGINPYKKKKIELNNLINDVIKQLEYQFKLAKINLVKSLSEDEIEIYADKYAVEEAIQNLLSNAIKYSPSGKSVCIVSKIKNEYAEIYIIDEGRGLSEDNIKRLFDPFYRDERDNKVEGAGLGLTIVKSIMEMHDGKILIESKLGEGSKFKLLFPLLVHL